MMTYEQTISQGAPDGTFVRRILLGRGFREVKSAGSQLRFQRGSTLRTLFAFSPGKWRTDVSVDTETGTARIDIRTTGQIVTESERAYADQFSAELFAELSNSPLLESQQTQLQRVQDSSALARAAATHNVRLAFATVAFSGFGTFALYAFFGGNIVLAVVSLSVGVVLAVYAAAGGKQPNRTTYD